MNNTEFFKLVRRVEALESQVLQLMKGKSHQGPFFPKHYGKGRWNVVDEYENKQAPDWLDRDAAEHAAEMLNAQ